MIQIQMSGWSTDSQERRTSGPAQVNVSIFTQERPIFSILIHFRTPTLKLHTNNTFILWEINNRTRAAGSSGHIFDLEWSRMCFLEVFKGNMLSQKLPYRETKCYFSFFSPHNAVCFSLTAPVTCWDMKMIVENVVPRLAWTRISSPVYIHSYLFKWRWMCFIFCRYLKGTLDQYVESDYTLIYFHHGLTSENKPSLGWLRDAYREFDRK